jgi:hypothetical protein
MTNFATSDIFSNLGSVFEGLSSLLLALGAGVGFLIRGRRTATRARLRTEAAAAVAAREAKKALEERLERQHSEQIKLLESQLTDLRTMHQVQVDSYKIQIADLQRDREQLLSRILREFSEKDEKHD